MSDNPQTEKTTTNNPQVPGGESVLNNPQERETSLPTGEELASLLEVDSVSDNPPSDKTKAEKIEAPGVENMPHNPQGRERDLPTEEELDSLLERAKKGDRTVLPLLGRVLDEEFVSLQCGTARRADRLEAVLKDLERQLGQLYHDLKEYDDDFQALVQLEKHETLFTAEEREELKSLFGLYGLETDKRLLPGKVTIEHAAERQQHWIDIRHRSRESARRLIAERAEARYGLLLNEMMQRADKAEEKPFSTH